MWVPFWLAIRVFDLPCSELQTSLIPFAVKISRCKQRCLKLCPRRISRIDAHARALGAEGGGFLSRFLSQFLSRFLSLKSVLDCARLRLTAFQRA